LFSAIFKKIEIGRFMAKKRFWGSFFKIIGVFLIGRVQNRFGARNSIIMGFLSRLSLFMPKFAFEVTKI